MYAASVMQGLNLKAATNMASIVNDQYRQSQADLTYTVSKMLLLTGTLFCDARSQLNAIIVAAPNPGCFIILAQAFQLEA
jgi:hypothetical protein